MWSRRTIHLTRNQRQDTTDIMDDDDSDINDIMNDHDNVINDSMEDDDNCVANVYDLVCVST